MLNPGTLAGDGANLSKDVTLRILRELFVDTGFNPYVINLFPFATPKPQVLFEHWGERDHESFSHSDINKARFRTVMYAYGDYENGNAYTNNIQDRIREIRAFLFGIPAFVLPLNKTRTPKHPIVIQRQKIKPVVRQAIMERNLKEIEN